MELALDVYFTLRCAAWSRNYLEPFSSVGYVEKKKRFRARFLIELAPLLFTGSVSLVLVGWRQKWWMTAEAVDTEVAVEAAKRAGALSVVAIGLCLGWGFLLNGGLIMWVIYAFMDSKDYEQWRYMLNPKGYWQRFPDRKYTECQENELSERRKRLDKLFEIQYGSSALDNLSREVKKRSIETSLLSIGNAIVGDDRSAIYEDTEFRFFHLVLLFAEHFTILPLQLCIAIGLVQVHDKLDAATFAAMKEVVDAVVVVAFVEIAVGLKTFLWGAAAVGELHKNDKRIGDP